MIADDNDARIYPELLKTGHTVTIIPSGTSNYPLLNGKSDSVIIQPKEKPVRVNDLILYKDKAERLVVHRVWKITESGYVLLGDGNIEKEFSILEENIYGICTAITRNGKKISIDAIGYKVYILVWRLLYPFRRYILKLLKCMGRKLK